MERTYDLVIAGGGPAGLSAAIYGARAGLSTLVIEGMQHGGQIATTDGVENYPGFAEPLSGLSLMEKMYAQAKASGALIEMDEITDVDLAGEIKVLKGMMGEYRARAVIVATGAKPKMTLVEGEKQYFHHGISTCAICDGAFFRGKEVAVIGGGDSALSEAIYLSGICKKVTIIHRRAEFRASDVLQKRVRSMPGIEFVLGKNVSHFSGDGKSLTAVALSDGTELPVSGAFVAIGHTPVTGFLRGKLDLDEQGYIVTRDIVKTSVERVFAAGDVVERTAKQAIIAAGEGARAALAAFDALKA